MGRNNTKFFFSLKYLFTSIVLLAMVFTFQLFPLKTGRLHDLAGESAVTDNVLSYDYVLVIDESGSMQRNDSANRRIDAAKLFVYLAETMNPGSRVLVSGFGETTNIYQQLTDISGNEKSISAAISKIRSDQDITDMKGALTKIKQILDVRDIKKKTVVIFLTDGSLTIDDIPAPTKEEQKPPRETTTETTADDSPGRPVKDKQVKQDGSIKSENVKGGDKNNFIYSSAGGSKDPVYPAALENLDTPVAQKDALENYKNELIDLCYKYSNADITIYPIAFTKEADISLLEQIAAITGGISWQAKEAKDIRASFIEILKNLTSRFIKIQLQSDSTDLSSSIPVGSYIKDLIVIGLQNNFNTVPQIMLTTPSGDLAEYNDYTEEALFKIGKVISPQEGDWAYKIKGDAIFVYDIVDAFISDPQYPVYTSDAKLFLKLDILKNSAEKLKEFTGDFKISANVLDPGGNVSATADLPDDGSNSDSKAGDGLFTGNFEGQDLNLKGNYTFNFLISHIPTGSVAGKSLTLEFVESPGKITVLEPSGDNYNLDKPVTVEVKLDKNEKISRDFNPENYKLTFSLKRPDGEKASDLVLLDNGQGADKAGGDGVYSAALQNTTLEGFYEIEFFIRDASVMTVPACTAIKKGFNLSRAPVLKIMVENNLFVTGSTIIRANFEDNGPNDFKYLVTAPDGTESSGILADDGSAANGDLKAADGVASIKLAGPGLMGQYKFKVMAEYKTEAGGSVPVFSETSFVKELSISKPDSVVEFEENADSAQATFKVLSQAASAKQIAIDLQKYDVKELDNRIIKSVKINGNKTLDGGSESSIVLAIELEDKVKSGNYSIIIPLIVDGNSTDSVQFDVSILPASAPYFIWIVIGAVVLAIAIIILFVYFLYIRPKKRGY